MAQAGCSVLTGCVDQERYASLAGRVSMAGTNSQHVLAQQEACTLLAGVAQQGACTLLAGLAQ